MKSVLNSISKKTFLIYLAIGAISAIGHMVLKTDRLMLTRISDGLFAGFVIPACAGIFHWIKEDKKEKKNDKKRVLTIKIMCCKLE